jgi:hypothetical protein
LDGADAVGAALVLLHLLEGQAQVVGQTLLADAENLAPHADAGADVQVDRIGGAFLVGGRVHAVSITEKRF